jgi:hypothetical protein
MCRMAESRTERRASPAFFTKTKSRNLNLVLATKTG